MNKAPVFQHRHYVAIAAELYGLTYDMTIVDRDMIIARFANLFESDNLRFDRARFLAAANGKPSNGRDKVRS